MEGGRLEKGVRAEGLEERVRELESRRVAAASWWCWWEVWLFGEFPAIQDIFPWRECRTKASVHSF